MQKLPENNEPAKQPTSRPIESQDRKRTIGRDEMNIAEFPIGFLLERLPRGLKTIRFEDTVVDAQGNQLERQWVVTGSDDDGLPRGKDFDVFQALMKLTMDDNFESKTIHFTPYEIFQILGWDNSGYYYKRLEKALARFAGSLIKTKQAFWDNEEKKYLTIGFNILDSYVLAKVSARKGRKSGRNRLTPTSSFTWGDLMFNSFQNGYIKPIDLDLFFSLNQTVSKRLYQYLDKKCYRKLRYEIDLYLLAYEKLGLSRNYYASQIKRALNQAHKELVGAGFLDSVEYESNSKKDKHKVIYRLVPKRERHQLLADRKELDTVKEIIVSPKLGILGDLLKEGINRKVAERLVRDYSEEHLRRQITALAARNVKNRTGALIRAIEEDWELPAAMIEKLKAPMNMEQIRARQEEELRKAEAQIAEFAKRALFKEHREKIRKSLKIGPHKERFEQIVKEETEKALFNKKRRSKKISEETQGMIDHFANLRLEEEGLLPSYEEWENSLAEEDATQNFEESL